MSSSKEQITTTVRSLVLSVSLALFLMPSLSILTGTHDLMSGISPMSAPSGAAKYGIPGSTISAASAISYFIPELVDSNVETPDLVGQ